MIVNKHLISIIANILTRSQVNSGKLTEIIELLQTDSFINTGKCINDTNGSRISWLFEGGMNQYYYNATGMNTGFHLLSDLSQAYTINDCESNYSHRIYAIDVDDSSAVVDINGAYDGADLFPASVDPSVQFIDLFVRDMDADVDATNWLPNNILDGCRVTIQKQSDDNLHVIKITLNGIEYSSGATQDNFFIIQWSKTDNKFYIVEN